MKFENLTLFLENKISKDFSFEIGKVYKEDIVYQYVQKIHHTIDDFFDGDLSDRIEKYSYYKLIYIDLSELDLDEFYIDETLVEDYVDEYKHNHDYPPIVYDPEGSIIDGIHRTNALRELGIKKVKALVGTKT